MMIAHYSLKCNQKRMPPFDTRLTRNVRIGIMLFFIMIFLIVSPLLVLYTAGYRYSWKDKTIKQTGAISIDATPREASVMLNDMSIHKKMPLRLTNITPGEYHLTIAREGHHQWEKDITVGSKETTYIKNISLFKDARPALARPATGEDTDLISSPEAPALLVVEKKDGQQELLRYDQETRDVRLIRRDSTKETPKIITSPRSPTFVVITQSDNETVTQVSSFNAPENMTPFVWDN